MILLIDSGNSRLKTGLLPDGAQRRLPDTAIFDNADPQALTDWLQALPAKPIRAVGVNVAGAARGEAVARIIDHACATATTSPSNWAPTAGPPCSASSPAWPPRTRPSSWPASARPPRSTP